MESLVKRLKTEEKACFGQNTHGGRKRGFQRGHVIKWASTFPGGF